MKLEQILEEYPVLLTIAEALEQARLDAVKANGGVANDRYGFSDETNNYFHLVNEDKVNTVLLASQEALCEPAWKIRTQYEDYGKVCDEMGASDAWPRDPDHLARLVCLYMACCYLEARYPTDVPSG